MEIQGKTESASWIPWIAALVMALVAVATFATGPSSSAGSQERPVIVTGPEAVVIETGSVEHRLRAMEAHLLEIRADLDSIRGQPRD